MEAKDTVMGEDKINVVLEPYEECSHKTDFAIAKAQAEISFKAGIKEVVDWIENKGVKIYNDLHPDFISHREIPEHNLQSKLKEWGMNPK